MNPMFLLRLAFTALALAAAGAAAAQTLYKLIDKNGKVTYSESAPKNFDGQVIRIDINPNANTLTLPKPAASTKGEEAVRQRSPRNDGQAAKKDAEERVRAAREKVEAAKRALQEARDSPGADDVQVIGNKGGGVRLVPSGDYQQKLAELEKALQDAEEELRRAEKEI